MQQLPAELRSLIISHLYAPDRLNYGRVNRQARADVAATPLRLPPKDTLLFVLRFTEYHRTPEYDVRRDQFTGQSLTLYPMHKLSYRTFNQALEPIPDFLPALEHLSHYAQEAATYERLGPTYQPTLSALKASAYVLRATAQVCFMATPFENYKFGAADFCQSMGLNFVTRAGSLPTKEQVTAFLRSDKCSLDDGISAIKQKELVDNWWPDKDNKNIFAMGAVSALPWRAIAEVARRAGALEPDVQRLLDNVVSTYRTAEGGWFDHIAPQRLSDRMSNLASQTALGHPGPNQDAYPEAMQKLFCDGMQFTLTQ